jgi:hypothetical protein
MPRTKKDQNVDRTRYLLMGGEFHFTFASKASSGGEGSLLDLAGSRIGAFAKGLSESLLPFKTAFGGKAWRMIPSVE